MYKVFFNQKPLILTNEIQEFSDTETQAIKFKLSDYLAENSFLDKEVNRIFESMDDTAIVA